MVSITNKQVEFYSKGLVYGSFWGGGYGAYQARGLSASTKEELIEKANELLKSGGLDSGMGFQRLSGAILHIEERTSIEVDGKTFFNRDYHEDFIGELTEEEKSFLMEHIDVIYH